MTRPIHQLRGTELKRLHRTWRRRSDSRLALLLDDVGNPYNVGSITRSAAAFGVDHLYLSGSSVSPRAPKAAKTALGTDRYLQWSEHATITEAITAARADGYRVVGIELADPAAPLADLKLAADVCLVLGHEERGISATGLAECDAIGYVPLIGRVGSLNVATAAAIACYEVRRQGWAESGADDQDGADQDGADQDEADQDEGDDLG
ncbi:TrmH family RNA methyltransferase [Cryptosporangium minutisporangium]|uniref:tRNA/rRNA methyltransferase SpoU type domain-containing protein n=1 Tax=Cryptosporangium minutisporangium TaxID=113569 RepID=A0ABP6T0D9_9ACTN